MTRPRKSELERVTVDTPDGYKMFIGPGTSLHIPVNNPRSIEDFEVKIFQVFTTVNGRPKIIRDGTLMEIALIEMLGK